MGGETVQKYGVRLRHPENPAGDAVGLELPGPLRGFSFLPHRGPYVRVDGAGTGNPLFDRRRDEDRPARLSRRRARPIDDAGLRGVAGRRDDRDSRPELRAGQKETVGHVVSVTEITEAKRARSPESLPNREEVGERLARME